MSDTKKMQVTYEVASGDFERAGEASSSIKRLLQRLGISAEVIRRIAIGTYEAEMNVIIHAGGGVVMAEISPHSTAITVTDKGPGIADIELAKQEGWSTAPDYVRQMGFGAGMGLPNMIKCSDKLDIVSVVNQGTQITMVFNHIDKESK